jgi:hypothetical protein
MSETLANTIIDISSRAPHSFDPDGSVFINGKRDDSKSIMEVSQSDAILKIDEAVAELERNSTREKHVATWFAASRF